MKTTRVYVVVFVSFVDVVVCVDAVVLYLLSMVVVDYNCVHVHFDIVLTMVDYHMKIHFDVFVEFHYQLLYDIKVHVYDLNIYMNIWYHQSILYEYCNQ